MSPPARGQKSAPADRRTIAESKVSATLKCTRANWAEMVCDRTRSRYGLPTILNCRNMKIGFLMSADDDVTSFIRSTFRSVWSLETMLFLFRNRERAWDRGELVAALRGSVSTVGHSIELLVSAGLIETDEAGAARFQPASGDLERLAAATAEQYARTPDAVRRQIVLAANSGLAAFADAFRLRRD